MVAFTIDAYLPVDRTLPGFLRVTSPVGAQLLYDIPCRGKADSQNAAAHGNPDRDPTRPWGDIPSGVYRPTRLMRYDPPQRTFGRFAILLEGQDGDALLAAQRGRTGLAIHGNRGNERLMATYGCLRLFDRDMELLAHAIVGTVVVTVHDVAAWPPREER